MSDNDSESELQISVRPYGGCARGLRKYFALLSFFAIVSLIWTAWYVSRNSIARPVATSSSQNMMGLSPKFSVGSVVPVAQSSLGIARTFDASPDFARIVSGLRGTVVSISRSRVNGFGANRAMGGEPGQPVAPRADGTLEFAAPAVGAVLETVGTGFFVRRDGYILTNYHVVRGSDSMVVSVFSQTGVERYAANIIKLDATVDLALLKIEPKAPLRELPLGDSDQTQVADDVIAVGSPFGLDLTVSRGIISAKRKSLVIEGTVHRDLLQTDAAINQGNSGGPLINRLGEIIGVNTAVYTPNGAFAGVGFAVSSNLAKLFLADEVSPQSPQAVAPRSPQTMAESSIGPWSLPVAAPPGTTALGAAGPPILAGASSPHGDNRDTMECAICHQLLPRSGTQANSIRAIPAAGPAMAGPPIVAGTPAPHRDGREAMNCATCHAFIPTTRGGAMAPVAQTGLQFARPPASLALNAATATRAVTGTGDVVIMGATIQTVTADEAGRIAQPEGKGVLVSSVAPGSPAALTGLGPGMTIEKVNGRRLLLPSDLTALVAMAKIGDILRLTVNTERGRQELKLTIPAGSVAPSAAATPLPTKFNWRGMEVETFAAVTPAGPGVGGQSKGAVIAEVSVTSPAQRAGLRANDIILEINGMPTGSAQLIDQALKMATANHNLLFVISRNNRIFSVIIP